MRGAIAALALLLAACAGIVSNPTAPPCTAELGADGAPCDWRALNASRPPQSFVGYYEATDPGLAAQLVIVDRGDGDLRVGLSAYSPSTTLGCSALLEGVRRGGRVDLTPLPEWGPVEECTASVGQAGRRDDIEFSMNNACSHACGRRVFPSGRYRLRRRD